ncbi:hypothetical protein FJY70_06095 [candidate division WOR-3 bacterium]|nr:hypothetical protein [candidate division WOR-3 bacterium]
MLGRFLFRWRGAIGAVAFAVLWWHSRPSFGTCWSGLPLLVLGLGLRFWASGYIGLEARAREMGLGRVVTTGPYRLLRHPLYIGNSLLVCGMLLSMRPPMWLAIVTLAGFAVEYALIAAAEERELAGRRRARGEGRGARGQSFRLRRALGEWRTWAVTGVAIGLVLVKAVLGKGLGTGG